MSLSTATIHPAALITPPWHDRRSTDNQSITVSYTQPQNNPKSCIATSKYPIRCFDTVARATGTASILEKKILILQFFWGLQAGSLIPETATQVPPPKKKQHGSSGHECRCPPTFCLLWAFVHIILWYNAIVAFLVWQCGQYYRTQGFI